MAYLNGPYCVQVEREANGVVKPDTLTLPGYFTGVGFAAGSKIQYVKLVTKEAHKRANGQRVSVAGVLASGGAAPAAPIPRINDGCGVIDGTSLSIPIETSGGTYTPGLNALIGDDGPHRSGDRCGGHRRGSVAEAACRPRRRALVRRQSQLEAGGAERSSRSAQATPG